MSPDSSDNGGPPIEQPLLASRNRPLMLVGTLGAMIMYTLDSTIANVALPHMSASLGATQDTITWVLTSYVIAAAVALPLAGWMVDQVGIRHLMIASVLLFTVASALCGVAQTIEEMVLFRVVQGLAGAFMAPLAQTITLNSSTATERPKMMGLYSQGVMLGPIAGPVVGGYLTDNYNWRWVFYVNLPVGLICFALLICFLPSAPTNKRKVDLLGWVLIAVTVSSLQLLLDRGPTQDWFSSAEIVVYAVLASSCAWMAVIHLMTHSSPLFPLDLLRDRNFILGLAFMFLIGLVMLSVMALLPGLLQQVYGYSPFQSGLLLCWRGISMLASISLFGRQMARLDPRMMMSLGLFLMGLSMWLMTGWSIDMPREPIIVAGLIQGMGISFTFVPMSVITFATLPERFRTDASGLSNLMRNLGASIGISAASVMLAHNIQVNHAEIGAHVTRMSVPIDLDQARVYGSAAEAGLRIVDGMVNRQAAMLAYIDDFYVMALACFSGIVLLLFVRPDNRTQSAMDDGPDLEPAH